MSRFKRIVVPTDFSTCSRAAIPYVRDLVDGVEGARVLLVHVMEPPIYPAMFEGAALALPAYDEEMQQRIRKHLDELAQNDFAGVETETFLRQGQPVAEVLGLAEEEKADLVVVATHGHTGFRHMILGSTTEQIVRQAPCPVLAVRPPADSGKS